MNFDNAILEKELLAASEHIEAQPTARIERWNGRTWYYDIDQGTDEWLKLRMGKITASAAACIIQSNLTATGKISAGSIGNLAKSAVTYCEKKAAEKIMNQMDNGYKSKSMQWGNENEDFALIRYSKERNCNVTKVGFVELNENIGCSPDGYVQKSRLIQIKCPEGPTHFGYLRNPQSLIDDYNTQIQFEMWVCGFKKCDLVSFHPFFTKESDQIIILTVEADKSMFSQFQERTNEMINFINSML